MLIESRWKEELGQMLQTTFQQEQLESLVTSLYSQNELNVHYGVIGLRKLASKANTKDVERMIEIKAVELLVQMMARANDSYPQICLEAVKAINYLL